MQNKCNIVNFESQKYQRSFSFCAIRSILLKNVCFVLTKSLYCWCLLLSVVLSNILDCPYVIPQDTTLTYNAYIIFEFFSFYCE